MPTSWEPTETSWEPADAGWEAPTFVQCLSLEPWLIIPGCDEPGGCHDLTLGRIYELVAIEANGSFYRIYDDSDEDILYPASHFKLV